MNRKAKVFRITDNPVDPKAPYALIDETNTVVRVHTSAKFLATLAFDYYRADEVRHDEDLLRADSYSLLPERAK